jgi:hypothetical protein
MSMEISANDENCWFCFDAPEIRMVRNYKTLLSGPRAE